MLLTNDFPGTRAETMLPTGAVYCRLAPVPAPVRGITLPSAVLELTTVEGTTNVHSTDMGAVAFIGRVRDGSAVGIADWQAQPSVGLKRHGATRGRPPREHLRGLFRSPIGPLEAATPATGIAAIFYGIRPGREAHSKAKNENETDCEAIESSTSTDATDFIEHDADRNERGDRVHDRHPHRT